MFVVYHPWKTYSIRVVFDSSAGFGDEALNYVLITGQDLNNLQRVLLRFRRERVADDVKKKTDYHDYRNYLYFLLHPERD